MFHLRCLLQKYLTHEDTLRRQQLLGCIEQQVGDPSGYDHNISDKLQRWHESELEVLEHLQTKQDYFTAMGMVWGPQEEVEDIPSSEESSDKTLSGEPHQEAEPVGCSPDQQEQQDAEGAPDGDGAGTTAEQSAEGKPPSSPAALPFQSAVAADDSAAAAAAAAAEDDPAAAVANNEAAAAAEQEEAAAAAAGDEREVPVAGERFRPVEGKRRQPPMAREKPRKRKSGNHRKEKIHERQATVLAAGGELPPTERVGRNPSPDRSNSYGNAGATHGGTDATGRWPDSPSRCPLRAPCRAG